jgi:hypothetical protein
MNDLRFALRQPVKRPACHLPARRTTRVSPIEALRAE